MKRRALVAYWLSEAPLVLRAKQIAAAVLPGFTQVALKRLYYLWVLRHGQEEAEAEGVRRLLRGGVAWTSARTLAATPGCSRG